MRHTSGGAIDPPVAQLIGRKLAAARSTGGLPFAANAGVAAYGIAKVSGLTDQGSADVRQSDRNSGTAPARAYGELQETTLAS